MPVQHMDKDKFLKHYELQLNKEFEHDGLAAQWASDATAHRFIGDEDSFLTLRADDPSRERGRDSAQATLSPDGRFLAVATNAVIRIYHVQSQELRAELIGHRDHVSQLHFAPRTANTSPTPDNRVANDKHVAYQLLSAVRDGRDEEDQTIAWALDAGGRQIQRTMPFAVQDMADRSVAAISADLTTNHNLSTDDMDAIRSDFAKRLQVADVKNRTRGLPVWHGRFPSFGTEPFSRDGESFLYTVHGDTTQHGMRPADKLPQIVVVELASRTERCRLKGHTDAIMWAGWSADGKTIATASWDSYYRIWDARTGECKHTIGPTGAQNWAGAFSPDGKYVLLSGGRDVKVAIYNVETGEEFAELKRDGLKLQHWIRYFDWNPAGDCIAISNGLDILLWHLSEGKVDTILSVAKDDTMLKKYNSFSDIKWAQGGKKLLLKDVSYTTFVWDREENVKWRFERPSGMPFEMWAKDVFYVEEMDTLLSLDGDRKVRYWKL